MGMHLLMSDDTIYFGVGEFKACYKQDEGKPKKVEICATVGKGVYPKPFMDALCLKRTTRRRHLKLLRICVPSM